MNSLGSISNGAAFELKRMFPNASKSCVEMNQANDYCPKCGKRSCTQQCFYCGNWNELPNDNKVDPQLQDTEPQRQLGGSHKTPRWTDSEDAVLVAYYKGAKQGKDFTVSPLIEVLKRSEAAIQCRSNALGITFKRGTQPRRTPKPIVSGARFTDAERSKFRSRTLRERHATRPHPMLGKTHSESARLKISEKAKGRIPTQESIMAGLRTKAKNGTLVPNRQRGTWKAGWREIGGRRIYARSRWEANYARYLELLKRNGEIREWEHEPETFWFEGIQRGRRSYLPDFRVTQNNRMVEYHECKGWMDARSRTCIRRMRKYHPKIALRVIDGKWFRSQRIKLRGIIPDWEDGEL